MPLGGLWEFKTGDNLAWASPGFDDSQWERLRVDESYSAQGHYRPAQEVGGDFFQVSAQADGSALVVLGDVSGKGLKAAMTVYSVRPESTWDRSTARPACAPYPPAVNRVRDLIASGPDAHATSEAAVAFGQNDDITVLTVARLATGAELAVPRANTEIAPSVA